MKIALVSQYFWPEPFALNELVRALTAKGHVVDIFTGKPNYPDGQLYPGYRREDIEQESFSAGATIYRVPLRPRGPGGAANLLRNYWSFVWNGWLGFPRMAKSKEYDVIFAINLSPITAVIPAIRLRRKLKVPMVMWVLDVWPDSLEATGYVRHPVALRMVGRLVRWIYGKADRILIQSRAFREPVGRYAGMEKLVEYASCAPDMPMKPSQEEPALPADLLQMLERDFCIVFTGNLGTAQALDVVLAAAEQVQDLKDLRVVLVGSGSLSTWLQEQKENRRLDNVVLTGRYPPEAMTQFLTRAKALLVSLSPEPIYAQTVPAKIQTYLAAGKPIIGSLDGEGARVINESGAGVTSAAGNAIQLGSSFRSMYEMTEVDRMQLGNAGRRYFLQHFEVSAQAEKLVALLQQTVAQQGRL